MAAEILSNPPSELVAGTSVGFYVAAPNWTPAEVSTATIYFSPRDGSSAGFSKTATDGGNGEFLVDLVDADSATAAAGDWDWRLILVAGGKTYQTANGRLEILPNPTAGAVDSRSFWERLRDNVRARLDGDQSLDVASYSFGGKSLAKYSRDELLDLLAECELNIRQEENARALRRGETPPNRSTLRLEL